MPNFNLSDYTNVADRLKMSADTWTSIIVSEPKMLTDVLGFVSVTVLLKDGRSATGIAHFRLDRQGKSAQVTHPLEDAETSALGRALGKFGFGTDRHFPSREEMEQVAQEQPSPAQHDRQELTGVLRDLRQQLTAIGGKVVPLTSSQVQQMPLDELTSLVDTTRKALDQEQKRLAAEAKQHTMEA